MKIITIIAKNNSLKFSLWNMNNEVVVANGIIERIGLENSRMIIQYNKEQIVEELECNTHLESIHILLDKLVALEFIKNYEDIDAISCKVLFGKEHYEEKLFLSNELLSSLEEYSWMETMKPTIEALSAFHNLLPNTDIICVFDNAFYHSLEKESYLYAAPYKWYREYGIRKYGYQGIIHSYVLEKIEQELQKENSKIISCCLDHEGSISAIKNHMCIDTTMGFTPLTGIMMGTKCGDIDPSMIPYIMEKEGKNVGEVLDDLNHNSGLLGLSESSSDLRDIMILSDDEHPNALLAKKKYVKTVTDYIAQYYIQLEGVDAIILTGFIGENNKEIQKAIFEKFAFLGIKINVEEEKTDEIQKISTEDSTIPVYIIPNKEEWMLAKKALELKNR